MSVAGTSPRDDSAGRHGVHGAARMSGLGTLLHRIAVIWRLEALQMIRPGAVVWAAGLALLPSILLVGVRALLALEGSDEEVFELSGMVDTVLYVLIPGVVCLLGLLLTATSALQSELENRTWIYLAVRPQAKLASLLGKYLFAVTWVMAIAVAGTAGTAMVLTGMVGPGTVFRTLALSLLACLAYGALYLFIGVAFIRVGMVVAIAYTLLVEIALGIIPAVVNEVTISYHLRSLFILGLPDGTLPSDVAAALGGASGSGVGHLAWIVGMALLFLGAATTVLRIRQAAALEAE